MTQAGVRKDTSPLGVSFPGALASYRQLECVPDASETETGMKRIMVRYKVKLDRAAENESHIVRVFGQLRRDGPAGLRYATFKLDDGVSFVHLVSIETADGRDPLRDVPAFKEFTAGIRDRCEEPPVAVVLNEVGSYGFFGE
jgi:hypothetical protein